MKKNLKTIIICVLIIILSGCRNMNITDEDYEHCKIAVGIVDDFLNKFIDSETAEDKIRSLSQDYEFKDLSISVEITSLIADFTSYNSHLSTSVVTTNDFRDSKINLEKICGL